ncbi:MAG: regulatory protein RecX [Eubacteriales bacterium]|uniref:regulatory protein RecX n=1 Tax=Fenollaria sp. TaxID=1965292 RepID=UPI0025E3B14A|nr:regulatory protein RecX [Fenollaria sp.]MDD7339856.1 regulatory protein RecX [Eubacteriales bacterium]MDY3106084.1 regulatory protein RecX [Fenollaria sp.]
MNEKAYNYAIKYLKNIKTKKDVYDYLIRKGFSDEETSEVCDYIEEVGLVDDDLYVKFFVEDSFRIKNKGARKIVYELKQRGIDDDKIEEAMEEASDMEYEALKEAYERKLEATKSETDPYKRKNKIIRFLISRGFDYSDIKDIVDL